MSLLVKAAARHPKHLHNKILGTEMLLLLFRVLQTLSIYEGEEQTGKVLCQCKQHSLRQIYCSTQQGTLQ